MAGFLPIARLGKQSHGGIHTIKGDEIDVPYRKTRGKEIGIVPQGNSVVENRFCGHKGGLTQRDAKPFALTDGIVQLSLMLTQHGTIQRNKVAGSWCLSRHAEDKGSIVTVRHKADILTILLMRHGELHLIRNGAGFGFGKRAEGEFTAGKCGLRERIQHIGLILGGIGSAAQQHTPRGRGLDPGIMPGRQPFKAIGGGKIQQGAEFDHLVAVYARIGGLARLIGRDEIVHHRAAKDIAKLGDIVGDPQQTAYGGSPLYIPPGGCLAAYVSGGQLHGNTCCMVVFLRCQVSGNGAVHTAAHGNENTVLIHVEAFQS